MEERKSLLLEIAELLIGVAVEDSQILKGAPAVVQVRDTVDVIVLAAVYERIVVQVDAKLAREVVFHGVFTIGNHFLVKMDLLLQLLAGAYFFLQHLQVVTTECALRVLTELQAVNDSNVFQDDPVNREDWHLFSAISIDLQALVPILYPALVDEVDSLSYVQACRKACVVRAGKGDHELTGPLKSFVHFYL